MATHSYRLAFNSGIRDQPHITLGRRAASVGGQTGSLGWEPVWPPPPPPLVHRNQRVPLQLLLEVFSPHPPPAVLTSVHRRDNNLYTRCSKILSSSRRWQCCLYCITFFEVRREKVGMIYLSCAVLLSSSGRQPCHWVVNLWHRGRLFVWIFAGADQLGLWTVLGCWCVAECWTL